MGLNISNSEPCFCWPVFSACIKTREAEMAEEFTVATNVVSAYLKARNTGRFTRDEVSKKASNCEQVTKYNVKNLKILSCSNKILYLCKRFTKSKDTMLNIELVDRLYAQLPREQQQQLIARLFKQSKQTIAYFRRTKDISLSKLETLADFFNIPLDALRQGSATPPLHVERDNKFVMENEQLRKEIEHLQALLRSKDETIEAKNETIVTLKSQLIAK